MTVAATTHRAFVANRYSASVLASHIGRLLRMMPMSEIIVPPHRRGYVGRRVR